MSEDETPGGVGRERDGDATLIGDLRALLHDGQTLVEAEVAFRQAQAAYAWKRGKGVVLLLVLALLFAFFTLVALVVGLLLALVPLLGHWGAMAVVTLALALAAGACFFLAVGRFRSARARLLGSAGGANP